MVPTKVTTTKCVTVTKMVPTRVTKQVPCNHGCGNGCGQNCGKDCGKGCGSNCGCGNAAGCGKYCNDGPVHARYKLCLGERLRSLSCNHGCGECDPCKKTPVRDFLSRLFAGRMCCESGCSTGCGGCTTAAPAQPAKDAPKAMPAPAGDKK
jgi:hypothetical protein